MLRYHSLIHIGIVELDGQPPCRPSNKHNHHGGAICCYSSMTVANQSPIPPGTSLKGAGRRRCARVLFNLADWPRKKLITNLSNIFQVYQLYLRLVTAKIMVSHPPTLTPGHASSPCYPPLRPPVFGWLLCFGLPTGGQFMPLCILF